MKAIRVKDRVGSGTSSYSILRAALPPLVALAAALWHGPFVIDDAYITFRYAENLASGAGLVFNPGEPVLGTTSPLMAMLLALFHLAGEEIPLAALELGIASGMLIVFIAQRLAARFVGPWEAAAVGICLALHPDLTLVANSGMETGLSMCAVYGTLLMTLRRKYLFAGLLGGVAFLLRPDGALVVALAAGHALLHAPRRAWQPLVAAGVVAAPWLIYATATYGGVVPHSIAAKQLIHADAALHILVRNFQRLVYGPVMEVLCLLAVVGLGRALLRKAGLLLVAIWMLSYLSGLSASGIAPIFPWYVTPLFPGVVILAGFGLAGVSARLLARRAKPSQRRQRVSQAAMPVGLALVGVFAWLDSPAWRAIHEDQFGRVRTYLAIGNFLRERCDPGDYVFVGEVGALAYTLPDQSILDSSGINSPEIYQERKADLARQQASAGSELRAQDSPAWVLNVISRYQPRYVITHRPWLHIRHIVTVPLVRDAYRRITLNVPGMENYYILERNAASADRGGE